MLLHEDDKVFVLNKPAGLAVQGGSGVNRHLDKMLEAWTSPKGEKPRLVHRLDRDTSGVLVVARTRGAAQKLTAAFRERDTQEDLLVVGQGRATQARGQDFDLAGQGATPRMAIACGSPSTARRGRITPSRSIASWRPPPRTSLGWKWSPIRGARISLRVHALHIGHPIIGDPKYFIEDPNWDFPGGVQKRLHLHARRIDIPHPSGGRLRVTAPLPPHMVQTWNLLGFDLASAEMDDE